MKVTITHHDEGRAFRHTEGRFLNMEQALNAYDRFAWSGNVDAKRYFHFERAKENETGRHFQELLCYANIVSR